MKLEILTGEQHPMYEQALDLYRRAFPRKERREDGNVLPAHPAFRPGVLTGEKGFLGIFFYWEAPELLFLEHFAVEPTCRNQGLGAQALKLLEKQGKPVVLEIEPPVDEITCRRKGFYERNGFLENPYPHIQPKYRPNDTPVPLVLLSRPERLTRQQWEGFERFLTKNVAIG